MSDHPETPSVDVDPAAEALPTPPGPVELDDAAALAALARLDEVTASGLEALLFLAEEPLDTTSLADTLELDVATVDAACQGLAVRHRRERRGTEVRRAAGGWRMYSSALARPVLERWALAGRTGRLTQAALETLAVIAYKQPISRQEIGEIRGVNADGAVRSLVARGLVEEVGRDEGPGQAVLYGTTTTFLERLGLDHLGQLPPMTEFLPEHQAPDEPELARLKDVRRTIASGGELPANGLREAASRRFGDVRARLAVAGSEPEPSLATGGHPDDDEDVLPAPSRTHVDRRDDDAAMDDLSDRLETAARSAMERLREAVSAHEAHDTEATEDDVQPSPAEGDVPAGPPGARSSSDAAADDQGASRG